MIGGFDDLSENELSALGTQAKPFERCTSRYYDDLRQQCIYAAGHRGEHVSSHHRNWVDLPPYELAQRTNAAAVGTYDAIQHVNKCLDDLYGHLRILVADMRTVRRSLARLARRGTPDTAAGTPTENGRAGNKASRNRSSRERPKKGHALPKGLKSASKSTESKRKSAKPRAK